MVGNAKGNEGNDDRRSPRTSVGGRGAGRRRSYNNAAAAPAWSAGVAAMVMGATMWIFGARFFGTFWQRTRDVKNRGIFVLMDQTERF